MPWATHVVQWAVQWVAKARAGANPIKGVLSSDWRLKLASMKLESLVIADQNAAVNTFSDFVLGSLCDPIKKQIQILSVGNRLTEANSQSLAATLEMKGEAAYSSLRPSLRRKHRRLIEYMGKSSISARCLCDRKAEME